MTIAGRVAVVQRRIADACARAGRRPGDVTLVAVSKTFTADIAAAALEAGVKDLGENRAQELQQKIGALGERAQWHFVGHLQSNKVRSVVGSVVLIHSVDRLGVGEAIARRARSLQLTQDVLLEVNVSGEDSKLGVEPQGMVPLARELSSLAGLRVAGLMTIPPYPLNPEDSRPYYRELKALQGELEEVAPGAAALSMGMSGDFEVAVEEGATIVRVGEAIFGPR